MLLAVAAIGVGLAATGLVWSHASQREKERELLFVGDQIRQAIERFYERSPGVKRYPKSLDELVSDARFPSPERHLRRIYADPMTGKADWVLMDAPAGGIMGVHSKSDATPIRNAAFALRNAGFQDAKTYQDWVFFHDTQPASTPAATPAATPPTASSPNPRSAAEPAAVQGPAAAPGTAAAARAARR